MQLDHLKKVIEEFGMEEISIFNAALSKQNSKHLLGSFDAKTIEDVESITLLIKSPVGVYYASEGRDAGKFPPLQSMKDYVKSHNIQFRNKKGQFITDKATAYLIGHKIATLGTKMKASHFLANWKVTKEFEDKAMQAFILDTKEELQKFIDQYESEQK